MTEPIGENPYAAARAKVAQALAGLPWSVHPLPPETVSPPCLIVVPARAGWVTSKGYVGLIVTLIAVRTGPQDNALLRLEDMIHRTRTALRAAGLHPGDSDGPQIPSDRLTVEIPITVRTAPL